jgi:hypothetical protein
MNTGTGTIALTTLGPLGTRFQTVTFTGSTLGQWCDDYFLGRALRGLHERDVGLHLDIFTNQYLFLEGVAPTPGPATCTSGKGAKEIFEVDVAREASAKATSSKSTTKSVEATRTREGIAASAWVESAILIERSRTILVVVLSLGGIGQQFVGCLSFRKLVFRLSIFVGVRVVLFGQSVISFLDFAGGCLFVHAEDLIGIGDCRKRRGSMEGLFIEKKKADLANRVMKSRWMTYPS